MSEGQPNLIRDGSVYISWQTRKALNYVPRESDSGVDALVEKILSGWLKEKYPAIVEHIQTQHEEDQAFKKKIAPVQF